MLRFLVTGPYVFHSSVETARLLYALCGVFVLVGVTACSPHDVRHDPPPPLALSKAYSQQKEAAEAAELDRWWYAFNDAELNRLVEHALDGSFDIQAAWARLNQARAAADIAGAPQLPTLDLALGANVQRINPANFGARGATPLTTYGYTGSLSAAYEVDVWARISSGVKASMLDRDAAADLVQAAAMTVTAQIADAYYDLIAARAQTTVVEAQRDLNAAFLEVLEARFGQGLATAVEVEQQRQLVIGASASLEQIVATEAVAGHRLAALSGVVPGSLVLPERKEVPELPPLPDAGLPSELLKRRPDLRAAQRRVEAADYRVAVAVADRYPKLSLSGSLTAQPSKLNDFLIAPIWQLAANLAQPIFDNGRRAAVVEQQRAVMAEAVADYGNAVLGAIVEVENALVQERQQRKQIEWLEKQAEVAQITLEQAQARYGQGVTDYLSVLTALRSAQDVERQLLDARRQVIALRISLCRALGGTWAKDLQPTAEAADEESS